MQVFKGLIKGLVVVGLTVYLPIAHADSPADYVALTTFATDGSLATSLETSIDLFIGQIQVQQFANSMYDVAPNFVLAGQTQTLPASSSPQHDFVQAHMQTYCSPNIAIEQSSFSCKGNSNATYGQLLELGDIRISTLLEPLTYTAPIDLAALNYIRNVTLPFPSNTMYNFISKPSTFNGNMSQQRSYASFLASQALLGVATYALDEMFAMRAPGSDYGVGGSAASQSILQVMENEATRRFFDPNYAGSANAFLNATTTTAQQIQADIAAMMAFQLWMDYHAYRQNERIAALLAAALANTASTSISSASAAINAGG